MGNITEQNHHLKSTAYRFGYFSPLVTDRQCQIRSSYQHCQRTCKCSERFCPVSVVWLSVGLVNTDQKEQAEYQVMAGLQDFSSSGRPVLSRVRNCKWDQKDTIRHRLPNSSSASWQLLMFAQFALLFFFKISVKLGTVMLRADATSFFKPRLNGCQLLRCQLQPLQRLGKPIWAHLQPL